MTFLLYMYTNFCCNNDCWIWRLWCSKITTRVHTCGKSIQKYISYISEHLHQSIQHALPKSTIHKKLIGFDKRLRELNFRISPPSPVQMFAGLELGCHGTVFMLSSSSFMHIEYIRFIVYIFIVLNHDAVMTVLDNVSYPHRSRFALPPSSFRGKMCIKAKV